MAKKAPQSKANFEEKSKKEKPLKEYKLDGLVFKDSKGLSYYKKLKKLLDSGFIESFNVDSLLKDNAQKTKYNAKKIIINGFKFDSMLESDFYLHLLKEQEKGRISHFELKPSFILQPSFKKNDENFAQIKYIADFKIFLPCGQEIIVDTKGMITPDFKIKLKLFEYKYPYLSLKVMKYVQSYGGWIEYNDWLKAKRNRSSN